MDLRLKILDGPNKDDDDDKDIFKTDVLRSFQVLGVKQRINQCQALEESR